LRGETFLYGWQLSMNIPDEHTFHRHAKSALIKKWPSLQQPGREARGDFSVRRHLYFRAIDVISWCAQDGRMSEAVYLSSRRSQRVFHKMRLKAHGRSHNGKKFREICETVVVNAHGGLLNFNNELDNGEMIVLENPITQEELECRVVFVGDAGNHGQRIGIEFLTPAPHFWGIDFEAGQGAADSSKQTN
jgi:hypothetical protein